MESERVGFDSSPGIRAKHPHGGPGLLVATTVIIALIEFDFNAASCRSIERAFDGFGDIAGQQQHAAEVRTQQSITPCAASTGVERNSAAEADASNAHRVAIAAIATTPSETVILGPRD